MKLYNTLSGQKEELLLPPEGAPPLKLFVCGPTVYDLSHIGHARTYIFFDFFAKYLRSQGFGVTYLQNITNIDDKIIARAKESGEDPLELAGKFTKEYLNDMRAIGVNAVDHYAPATQFIPQIVRQIERLKEKDFAYKIEGDGWYFDIAQFKEYGKLSGRTALQAEDAVTRIDESLGKRNKGDFCLWKFSREGEPVWETALGAGRPGWHIEDTAISEDYFGPQYDIHGGAVDLKFPHHEAEIAQQEAASGKSPFVRFWMHTGFLTVESGKMSKSVGNFVTIRSFLESHTSQLLRFFVLSAHYRSPVDYDPKTLEDASRTLHMVGTTLGKIAFAEKSKKGEREKELDLSSFKKKFTEALADDMNTPSAFSALFEAINAANPILWELSPASLTALQSFLEEHFGLFGIQFAKVKIPKEVADLALEREKCRTNKQFEQSDALRERILGLGYSLEDTPLGPFVWASH